MIRILLVDDHSIVRACLRALLTSVEDFEVVGEISSGEEAQTFVKENSPDIVLMDIQMPCIGGLEATRRLLRKNHELKVIVLTALTHRVYPHQLISVGARGYLTKTCPFDEAVKAIRVVNSGDFYFESSVCEQLAEQSIFSSLSPKEMQISLMLMDGYSDDEIGKKLYLSRLTINTYRHKLLKKAGAKNIIGLINLARKEGLFNI